MNGIQDRPTTMRISQFGADTVISGKTRLILMDCFETLVVLKDGNYEPRQGVVKFLDHFTGKHALPIAVISDATAVAVNAALRQAKLFSRIRDIYHVENASEALSAGRLRKRLDIPLRDYALHPDQAVFIGDSPLDAEAAAHYGVPFIRVPRSEDQNFSFAGLIKGPSRYDSGEFLGNMLRTFQPVSGPSDHS